MLKEKRGMEAEKLCLTDGMVQYISAALLLATRPPRSKKNLLKNMKSKGKKATIAFFINHIHYSVVVYHCLFRNANTGKKTTQSGYCGGGSDEKKEKKRKKKDKDEEKLTGEESLVGGDDKDGNIFGHECRRGCRDCFQ